MGADIYGVVEIDHSSASFLSPHGLAYFEWSRFSGLFLALGVYDQQRKVPNRGFPESVSMMSLWHYAVEIVPDGEISKNHLFTDIVSETDAIELIDSGDSHLIAGPHSDLNLMSDPSHVYPNWITAEELKTVYDHVQSETQVVNMECEATITMMHYLKSQDIATRFVYWFDV